MSNHDSIIILRCEQAFHPGTGAGMGVIDKPIQRSGSTGLPVFWDSGLKGSMKDASRKDDNMTTDEHQLLFGSDNNGDTPSSGLFTEAHVLLFPVRSARGLFTWITCPYILNRFFRYNITHKKMKDVYKYPDTLNAQSAYTANPGNLDKMTVIKKENNKAGIEEFIIDVIEDQTYTGLSKQIAEMVYPGETYSYWKEHLENNLLVVSNELFRHIAFFDTEIRTRNRINDKGVAAGTALFVTEYLPELTVLYAFTTVIGQDADNLVEKLRSHKNSLLAGGNITIGKGMLNLHMLYEGSEQTTH